MELEALLDLLHGLFRYTLEEWHILIILAEPLLALKVSAREEFVINFS